MEIPGTVSRILWHFTGGPSWNAETEEISMKPKSLDEAYKNLTSILTSKELKISEYYEIHKVIGPETEYYNPTTKRFFRDKGEEHTIDSSPFCCLADIPIQHLHYHATRYGKCAIGFYRESAIRNDFNPVFYMLQNSAILNSIFDGMCYSDLSGIRNSYFFFDELIPDFDRIYDKDTYQEALDIKEDIYNEISSIDEVIEPVIRSFKNLAAFIKSFSPEAFRSIYCEREWRSLKPFKFEDKDIALVVVPRKKECYNDLIHSGILPRKIPIIPWEDLIEY